MLRFVLACVLVLIGSQLYASRSALASPPDDKPKLKAPYCDPSGVKARRYSKAETMETRERVQAVCKHVGASKPVCAYLDAVVVRESSGRAGVRHTKGTPEKGITENGLGPMGLSLHWHRDKWPGKDEDPMFCHPEVSALVALDIVHRAYGKWGARNLTEVQAIYGGSWGCFRPEANTRASAPIDAGVRVIAGMLGFVIPPIESLDLRGEKECGPVITARTRNVCRRLDRYDVSCWRELSKEDIGTLPPMDERRDLAARLAFDFGREE
mgnify:CR=1 FL=1